MTGREMQEPTTTARRLNELVHPSDREIVRAVVIEAFKNDRPVSAEFRVGAPPGQWKRILANGRVTERDSTGRAVRLIGTVSAAD